MSGQRLHEIIHLSAFIMNTDLMMRGLLFRQRAAYLERVLPATQPESPPASPVQVHKEQVFDSNTNQYLFMDLDE